MVMLTQEQLGGFFSQSAYNPNSYPLTVANPPRNSFFTPQTLGGISAVTSNNLFPLLNTATGNVSGLPLIQQDPFSVMPGLWQAFAAGYPGSLTQPTLPNFGGPTNAAMGTTGMAPVGGQLGGQVSGLANNNSVLGPLGLGGGYYGLG